MPGHGRRGLLDDKTGHALRIGAIRGVSGPVLEQRHSMLQVFDHPRQVLQRLERRAQVELEEEAEVVAQVAFAFGRHWNIDGQDQRTQAGITGAAYNVDGGTAAY